MYMSESLVALIQSFIVHSVGHAVELSPEYTETANRHHRELQIVLREIIERGDAGYEALAQLLEHSNLSVRLWAATALLGKFPDRATGTLEELAQHQTHIGFNAEMTLKEWRAGRLKLPPFDSYNDDRGREV